MIPCTASAAHRPDGHVEAVTRGQVPETRAQMQDPAALTARAAQPVRATQDYRSLSGNVRCSFSTFGCDTIRM